MEEKPPFIYFPIQGSTFKIGGIEYRITEVWHGNSPQTVLKWGQYPVSRYDFETTKEPVKRYKMGAGEFIEKLQKAEWVRIPDSLFR